MNDRRKKKYRILIIESRASYLHSRLKLTGIFIKETHIEENDEIS